MQLDNQKEIAEMQNETQKEIAGIQSATSRQNTKDQVYAQNEMLAYQQKESTARVASIMENTNLSKQQQVSEIMRQMLTQEIGRASCRESVCLGASSIFDFLFKQMTAYEIGLGIPAEPLFRSIAGIQSATSRQNTKDQVYAQNEMLAYQQKESTARVASIMENTNLSKQQQVSEIMRQMLTQAQTAGQYFTNDQIKEMTRKVSAEVDLVHQQTQNQRYGSSHIGATAKDISNVVTDAASGVVDIFHGIDKAVADTWNNFWK